MKDKVSDETLRLILEAGIRLGQLNPNREVKNLIEIAVNLFKNEVKNV